MTTQLTTIEQEVLETEARRIDAMVRQDLPALAATLADDMLYTHSAGRTDDKAAFLALIGGNATRYVGVDYSGVTTVPCGSDTVVVRGRAQIRLLRSGEPTEWPVAFLDVYTRRDGRWQMVSWSAVRLPD